MGYVFIRRACERYGLKPLEFDCLDMERVCKTYQDHPDAHGLSGYVRAYCGEEPKNQHRSDGDAYATMMLLRAICELHGLSPKKIKQEFADQLVSSMTLPEPKPERYRRPKKQIDAKTEQTEANPKTEMAPSAPKKKRRRRSKKKPTPKLESGQVQA